MPEVIFFPLEGGKYMANRRETPRSKKLPLDRANTEPHFRADLAVEKPRFYSANHSCHFI